MNTAPIVDSEEKGETTSVADEGDIGAAPLQNAPEPDETFARTEPRLFETDKLQAASNAFQAFEETITALQSGSGLF